MDSMYSMTKEHTFKAKHTGGKSKEALAQELWSLENQSGMIKTKKEQANYNKHLQAAKDEWEKRYGTEDYIAYWKTVFKRT